MPTVDKHRTQITSWPLPRVAPRLCRVGGSPSHLDNCTVVLRATPSTSLLLDVVGVYFLIFSPATEPAVSRTRSREVLPVCPWSRAFTTSPKVAGNASHLPRRDLQLR